MTRKFKYKLPISALALGLFWLVTSIIILCTAKPDEYWYDFLTELVFAIPGVVIGLWVTIGYIKQSSSSYIVLGDAILELPKFLRKPDSIKLSDIRYVTQTYPEDEIIKISSVTGFYRFNKKNMSTADFEELMISLQRITNSNLAQLPDRAS